jgi:two-component system, LytTR family, response regulator
MIRCLIVDDEPMARKRIRALLEKEPDCAIVGECQNGPQTLAAVDKLTPDLVFLDIQIPGLNGLEVMTALSKDNRPAVIFVTAYDRYALKAFEQHAVDYLLKPFDNERFSRSLDHVRKLLAGRVQQGDLSGMLGDLLRRLDRREKYVQRVSVKEDDRIIVIAVDEIEWIEADKRCVKLHLGKRSVILRESIGNMEKRLDPRQFIRIHRSYIVRCSAIREVQRWVVGSWLLVLAGGAKLDVSRNYRPQVARVINLGAEPRFPNR